MANQVRPLSAFAQGEEFIIEELTGKEEALVMRLEQLGFQKGRRGICLFWNLGKKAQAFRINQTVIALRREEADTILAVPLHASPCIMLAGNPNVGKTTLFNHLTGMHQHTGNWPGKTVKLAQGTLQLQEGETCELIDLPGSYSLQSRSEEERVTEQLLREETPDGIVVVFDASSLEKSLRFTLEIQQLVKEKEGNIPLLVCVNLCDEAKRKGIQIDFERLEEKLGCPVVQTCAVSQKGLEPLKIGICQKILRVREENGEVGERISFCETDDSRNGKHPEREDKKNVAEAAEEIVKAVVKVRKEGYWHREYQLDRFLTHPFSGTLCMLVLLLVLFWLTLYGTNVPSRLLFALFTQAGKQMCDLLAWVHCPSLLASLWLDGIWKVCSWVVSVMLIPMAIFFPLFTILEDLGYLPRIAFQLDGCFRRCRACGKQALTMCMGLGCNAVGVTGCRIIDTKPERRMAILTNALIPCNGRYPSLILLITMFFAGENSFLGGIWMCGAVLTAVLVTFLSTWLLSFFVNREGKSAFILEMPSYRRPQLGQILTRSLLDRTLSVLTRAILASAPAGILIWAAANVRIPADVVSKLPGLDAALAEGGAPLLRLITAYLDYPASWLGLDGAILFAFILGFPANEIVIPALLMCYLQTGTLVEVPDVSQLKDILLANGWTLETALCMLLFTLFHWPCATTCMTIRRETGSFRWMLLGFLLPAMWGIFLCGSVHGIWSFLIS